MARHASPDQSLFSKAIMEHPRIMDAIVRLSYDHQWSYRMHQDLTMVDVGAIAVMHGHDGVFSAWLKAGHDRDTVNADRMTYGHVAADRGHAGILDIWLKAGGSVMAVDAFHRTIGHMAARETSALDVWVAAGGDMDVAMFDGKTIGHIAAAHAHLPNLMTWVQRTTIPNATTTRTSSVMHVLASAASETPKDGSIERIMDAWVARGGDIHLLDHQEDSIGSAWYFGACVDGLQHWIRLGGSVLDGRPTSAMHRAVLDFPPDHPSIMVTQTCLRICDGHDVPLSQAVRSAFVHPDGHRTAQRLLLGIREPLHLARFIGYMRTSS
jgi:hypothetical protein